MKNSYTYILASQRNGTLYVGVTTDLIKRVYEHKSEAVEGFSQKYGVKTLVYFEIFENIEAAIKREKQVKSFKREWKIELIEKTNPNWDDLYEKIH